MRVTIIIASLLCAGCINITSQVTPENESVPAAFSGSDCSYIILGVGFGTNTVEQAMKNADVPIGSIRTVKSNLWQFMSLIGASCIEVNGAPIPGATRIVKPVYIPGESQ